jgi:thiamine monophosphate kinase
VPREREALLAERARKWSCECTRIGEISGTEGIRLMKDDREVPLPPAGFEHFQA